MPCIQIYTNRPISSDTASQLKSQLGKVISLLPNKSEDWLMVSLQDQCSMSFHGLDNIPCAFVEVKVWGTEIDKQGSLAMTATLTDILQQYLQVQPKDQYIRYIATPDWGWNGTNF